jgi:hypothetical protein
MYSVSDVTSTAHNCTFFLVVPDPITRLLVLGVKLASE